MELAHFAGGEKRNQKYAEEVMAENLFGNPGPFSFIIQIWFCIIVFF